MMMVILIIALTLTPLEFKSNMLVPSTTKNCYLTNLNGKIGPYLVLFLIRI